MGATVAGLCLCLTLSGCAGHRPPPVGAFKTNLDKLAYKLSALESGDQVMVTYSNGETRVRYFVKYQGDAGIVYLKRPGAMFGSGHDLHNGNIVDVEKVEKPVPTAKLRTDLTPKFPHTSEFKKGDLVWIKFKTGEMERRVFVKRWDTRTFLVREVGGIFLDNYILLVEDIDSIERR